ncbi:Bloom syndrome protein -like protein [Caligus rogercresseyi]|uniref:Bloom syndrome protein -like protein n=1 Tax=Caligus rogercresseyi TaxID=217165 RepID=A0A7T8GUS8_CALRO|nr:Bloom syndrome protein -like protein [Caligus rogercresseyi]
MESFEASSHGISSSGSLLMRPTLCLSGDTTIARTTSFSISSGVVSFLSR